MGLFSKGNKMSEDALNLCITPGFAMSSDQICAETLFLETTDGYINKSNYTPENMKKVTAFLIGGPRCAHNNSWEKRVPINEANNSLFDIKLLTNENINLSCVNLVSWSGFRQAFGMALSHGGKLYTFDAIGDLYAGDEYKHDSSINAINNGKYYYANESCIYTLQSIINGIDIEKTHPFYCESLDIDDLINNKSNDGNK